MRTDRFAIAVAADQATVWRALTDPCRTAAFFFGLRVESTWEPGATVTFAGAGPEPMSGSVLVCDPPHRLCYGVGGPVADDADAVGDDSLSWLSWELEECGPGLTRVTLVHDELGATGPCDDPAWRGLLSNLETYLDSDRPLSRRTPRIT
jgi:uncharacterized protein YndB with AHSA1/START domain